jgi:hypothetical protein
MLEILATTERSLRVEFDARVAARKKNSLSGRFRELHKAKGYKIRLDDDISGAMKDECVLAAASGSGGAKSIQ